MDQPARGTAGDLYGGTNVLQTKGLCRKLAIHDKMDLGLACNLHHPHWTPLLNAILQDCEGSSAPRVPGRGDPYPQCVGVGRVFSLGPRSVQTDGTKHCETRPF